MSKTKSMSEFAQAVTATKRIAILTTTFQLLAANNTVTSLEVKTAVRNEYSDLYTTQDDVSKFLAELADEKILTYKDNGTYRTYSDPRISKTGKGGSIAPIYVSITKTNTKPVVPKETTTKASTTAVKTQLAKTPAEIKGSKISRIQALAFMENNKGHFFTAVFTTKKNKLRTINGQYLKDQDGSKLGYVKVREINKLKNGEDSIRNVNIQTLEQLSIGGKVFNVG